jgi:hypothetical protein
MATALAMASTPLFAREIHSLMKGRLIHALSGDFNMIR